MTYLWRYRITDMHRIRVTERLGVRLPAWSPRALTAVSARGLKNGRSSPRRTSTKNGVTTARLRMPGTLSLHDHRDVQTLSMNCNCGDLRSFCTVAANRRRRFSQRAATVRSRLSPSRRHLRNLHDPHNKDIDHHLDEKLGNLCGFLNSQDHEDRLCVTTGIWTTTRDIDTMGSNWGISMEF